MPSIVTHQQSPIFGQHWAGLKSPLTKHRWRKHALLLHIRCSAIDRFSHNVKDLLVVAIVVKAVVGI